MGQETAERDGRSDTNRADILIVEDDYFIADYFRVICEHMGYSVCGVVPTAEKAILEATAHRPRLVLMDLKLQGEKDGVYAARKIYEHARAPVVFITASSEPKTVARIKEEDHPAEILFKPVLARQLSDVCHRYLES